MLGNQPVYFSKGKKNTRLQIGIWWQMHDPKDHHILAPIMLPGG